jgi:hypothetical protein
LVTEDPIVNAVLEKFKNRSDAGMKKYGVTMERTDIDTLGWIKHAQEEAMDFILYLERLKQDFIMAELIKETEMLGLYELASSEVHEILGEDPNETY